MSINMIRHNTSVVLLYNYAVFRGLNFHAFFANYNFNYLQYNFQFKQCFALPAGADYFTMVCNMGFPVTRELDTPFPGVQGILDVTSLHGLALD